MENDFWNITVICHCRCGGLRAITFYVGFPGVLLNISPKGASRKPQPVDTLNQSSEAWRPDETVLGDAGEDEGRMCTAILLAVWVSYRTPVAKGYQRCLWWQTNTFILLFGPGSDHSSKCWRCHSSHVDLKSDLVFFSSHWVNIPKI